MTMMGSARERKRVEKEVIVGWSEEETNWESEGSGGLRGNVVKISSPGGNFPAPPPTIGESLAGRRSWTMYGLDRTGTRKTAWQEMFLLDL